MKQAKLLLIQAMVIILLMSCSTCNNSADDGGYPAADSTATSDETMKTIDSASAKMIDRSDSSTKMNADVTIAEQEVDDIMGGQVAPAKIEAFQPAPNSPKQKTGETPVILVNKFANVTVDAADFYCEKLTQIVGHIVKIDTSGGQAEYSRFAQPLVSETKAKAFLARTMLPLRSGSEEKEANKNDIIKANLLFLDGNIEKEEYYKYTDQPVLSLSLEFEDVNQALLKKFLSDTGSNRYFMVEAAEVRQISITKYRKTEKRMGAKNFPPFLSAISSGGEVSITTRNADKKIVYKLFVKLGKAEIWLKK